MKKDVEPHQSSAGGPHPEDEEARPTRDRRPVTRPLPHERDQVLDPENPGPREVTGQAARDIARGLRDTDRGVPSDVPGPGVDPEHSPGADVPREGGDRDNHNRYPRSRVRAPALRRRKR